MILCFLQNQWAHDPAALQHMMDRHPHGVRRRAVIKRLLFVSNCLTGRRVDAAFGDLLGQMQFENIHPRVASYSSGCFGIDPAHVTAAIVDAKPRVLLAFGRVAEDAIRAYPLDVPKLYSPHPAARGADVPGRLAEVASQLRTMIATAV